VSRRCWSGTTMLSEVKLPSMLTVRVAHNLFPRRTTSRNLAKTAKNRLSHSPASQRVRIKNSRPRLLSRNCRKAAAKSMIFWNTRCRPVPRVSGGCGHGGTIFPASPENGTAPAIGKQPSPLQPAFDSLQGTAARKTPRAFAVFAQL
jgi:hypothetical protein